MIVVNKKKEQKYRFLKFAEKYEKVQSLFTKTKNKN